MPEFGDRRAGIRAIGSQQDDLSCIAKRAIGGEAEVVSAAERSKPAETIDTAKQGPTFEAVQAVPRVNLAEIRRRCGFRRKKSGSLHG
jgi:hypothetical protein